jgi:hypothetical protein
VNNLKYVFGREGGIIAGKSFDLARKRRTQAPLTTTRDLACLKIKPEEIELAGTLVSRSIKGCAKEGWEICLFLTKIFFPEAAEIGGKVPRAAQRFEQFCDTSPGLRNDWLMVDRGCSYRLYSGLQSLER